MDATIKVKVGDQVCYWLVYGQPYLATVDVVYADQVNAAGGPTIDLTYGGIHKAPHVPYDPSGQPHAYCLDTDPGWSGTLPKSGGAKPDAEAPVERPVLADKPVLATASRRSEPK